jgi:hypothetical protein
LFLAPICAVGTYTVEHEGLEYVVSRVIQKNPNKEKEAGRTFEELTCTSGSSLSLLRSSISLNVPSYSFGSLLCTLSDLFFIMARLDITLISTIIWTGIITHLKHSEVGDTAPYRSWE